MEECGSFDWSTWRLKKKYKDMLFKKLYSDAKNRTCTNPTIAVKVRALTNTSEKIFSLSIDQCLEDEYV